MMNFTTDFAVNGDFREGFLYCNRLDGGMITIGLRPPPMVGATSEDPPKIGFWMGFWGVDCVIAKTKSRGESDFT